MGTDYSRRSMLQTAGCGFGYLAFADLLSRAYGAEQTGATQGGEQPHHYESPLKAKAPHFAAKAKRVIFLFMQGAPSHVDTFDYKPELAASDGKNIGGGARPGPRRAWCG